MAYMRQDPAEATPEVCLLSPDEVRFRLRRPGAGTLQTQRASVLSARHVPLRPTAAPDAKEASNA